MITPADDLDRIMAVMKSAFDPAFGEAWNRRQVEDALILGNCHYILVDNQGKNASDNIPASGFTLSRSGYDEEELLLFAVDPAHRRRGIGRQLLSALVTSAKSRNINRLFLEMRRGNSAESLYRAFGFNPVGERPKYYRLADGNRIDAITFVYRIE